MDIPKTLVALPEPAAPGFYLGWICDDCGYPIKVYPKDGGRVAEPSPFFEIRCPTCKKTHIYPWTKRKTIEVHPRET